MTIKELYNWAVEKGVENCPIGIKYQDDKYVYEGDSWEYEHRDVVPGTDSFADDYYVVLK